MFHKCKSKKECKSLYFKIAQFLHPDKGGDSYLFSLLNDSYEMALEFNKEINSHVDEKRKYASVVEDVYDSDLDALQIVEEIYEYAKTHPKFSTDYLDSVSEFLEERGFMTSSQYNSLVRVYYSFKMEKKDPKNCDK